MLVSEVFQLENLATDGLHCSLFFIETQLNNLLPATFQASTTPPSPTTEDLLPGWDALFESSNQCLSISISLYPGGTELYLNVLVTGLTLAEAAGPPPHSPAPSPNPMETYLFLGITKEEAMFLTNMSSFRKLCHEVGQESFFRGGKKDVQLSWKTQKRTTRSEANAGC